MFNPVVLRSPRLFGIIGDLGRLNRRMHNKSLTADGQVAMIGYLGNSSPTISAKPDEVAAGYKPSTLTNKQFSLPTPIAANA
jgi:phosphatidylserine/phosphatidylglycerophosphate/cardiolipin synthase-like enzyme